MKMVCVYFLKLKDNWAFTPLDSGMKYVKYSDLFKIKHLSTGLMLHSHLIRFNISPYSDAEEQEVTCFGGMDENDYWKFHVKDVIEEIEE
jgi:dolichyl-phosphate-mannose--protein O-mannosyl transferase